MSPADGVVTAVHDGAEPNSSVPGGPSLTIFLSLWDVHVNRAPQDGIVEKVTYEPGKHSLAWTHSAAANESNWIHFQCEQYRLVVRQIAGMAARRVVCRLKPGHTVRKGQRIGIIKLGSRTDLHLPPGSRILVQRGDRVYGASSIVALMPSASDGAGA